MLPSIFKEISRNTLKASNLPPMKVVISDFSRGQGTVGNGRCGRPWGRWECGRSQGSLSMERGADTELQLTFMFQFPDPPAFLSRLPI